MTSSDTGTSIEEESFVSAEEIDRFQLDERQLELTRLLHRGRRGVRVYRALYRNSPVAIKYISIFLLFYICFCFFFQKKSINFDKFVLKPLFLLIIPPRYNQDSYRE